MKVVSRRLALAAAVAISGASCLAVLPGQSVRADSSPAHEPPQQIAAVEKLKAEAFHELRDGHFDKSNDLLKQAASLSGDPQVEQMSKWTSGFETQREEFAAERHKQYDKAVADVKLLESKEKPDYATDAAREAYIRADDKKTFSAEPWVQDLVKSAIHRAEDYDKQERWVRALRLYTDLTTLEPSQPLWKDRLKLVTRRVRLLAMFTPDLLKSMQENEVKEREEIAALLDPTTRPATQPATRPLDAADSDTLKSDWHDTLKGIKKGVLWDALVDARLNYYREVSFRDLAIGGLNGLEAVATTKGLEKAFPKLADEGKRSRFLAVIQDRVAANKDASPATQQLVLHDTLDKIEAVNRETVELPEEVWVSEFADGAFAELDPFSSMIWPTDVEDFRKTTMAEFSGVGIQIISDDIDGSLKVVTPLPDSPAQHAGIKPDDVITKINGKSAKGITTNQAVKSITGPKGSMVVLTVQEPDGHLKDYSIKREEIHVASIKGYTWKPGGGWNWFIDPAQKIAYIRLTSFTQDTVKELDAAIDSIQRNGARGIILDLRYDPGGLLSAAIQTCDRFLSSGVIVSTRPDRPTGNHPTEAKATRDEDDCTLPLVVLVNQYSASASEIVSGALKDDHRALIVGERTFGKGSVQMLFPLAEQTTLLKLTTSHYYLPSGRCLHREENSTNWGVEPDVTVEMTPEQMRTAIDIRQEMDILRDVSGAPAEGELPKLQDKATAVDRATKSATRKKDILETDPQLSAAILMLRLELNGAHL